MYINLNLVKITVLTVSLVFSSGYAAVLHVPGNYPSIQQAIGYSKNGDTIIAAPGVYHESIDFTGKAITVSSANPADANIVRNTVILALANRMLQPLDIKRIHSLCLPVLQSAAAMEQ